MSGKGDSNIFPKQSRRDQLVQEFNHDPYHAKLKLKDDTTCKSCRAVFKKGRWTWDKMHAAKLETVCPACQRVKDNAPAGFLTITQDYLSVLKQEKLNLIRHVEERESKTHPMKRLMAIEENDELMLITLTEPRLARNIGDALKKAYGGELNYEYTAGEFMLRVKLS